MQARPGRARGAVIAGAALIVGLGGCVAGRPPRDARSAAPTAILTTTDLLIDSIDGENMRLDLANPLHSPRTQFVVAVGRHELGVSRHAFKPGTRVLGSEYAITCVDAAAGRNYSVRPLLKTDGSWTPAVFDVTAGTAVPTTCAPPTTPVIAEDGVADGATTAAATVSAPVAPSVTASVEDRRPHRPGTGIALRNGIAYGGDMLAGPPSNSTALNAGDGWGWALAATITPLWNARDFGLGAGAEVGWKHAWFGSADSFTRYPLLVNVHLLARVYKRSYVKVGAGVEKDFDCRISRSGGTEVSLQGRWGPAAEVGLLMLFYRHGAVDLLLRYSGVRYADGPTTIDGSSLGLTTGLHYEF